MNRPASTVYVLLAATAFAYGAWHAATEISRPGPWSLDVAGLLGGSEQLRLEKAFDDSVPHKAFAADLLGSYRLAVFDEGHDGVVVGSDGWLFSSEEFRTAAPDHLDAALGYVRDVARALERDGIRLVVALVPPKASVEADRLGRYRLPSEAASRYDRVRETLSKDGIAAPDVREALASVAGPAYMRTDTHWSPEGAKAAAAAVASAAGATPGGWRLEEKGRRSVTGDLESFRKAPYAPAALRPGSGEVTIFDAVEDAPAGSDGQASGDVDIFAATAVPVVLVGTSYSASSDWSFEPSLKAALGMEVLNLAESGKGPFEPMRKFVKGLPAMEAKPETVVWEIPVRYLALPETDVKSDAADPDLVAGASSSSEGPSL